MAKQKTTVKQDGNANKETLLKTIDEVCENIKISLDEQFATPERGEIPPQTEKKPLEKTDELYGKILKYAVEKGYIIASDIRERFSIGFIRAKGYIEDYKSNGYIAEKRENNGYKVLLTMEQFNAKFQ